MESDLFMPLFEIDFENKLFLLPEPLEIVFTSKYVRRGFNIDRYTKKQLERIKKPDLRKFLERGATGKL
ncbi:MAG: hypothetical protein ACFE9L_18915 [Candidatus Hodarchaeota archaeon]